MNVNYDVNYMGLAIRRRQLLVNIRYSYILNVGVSGVSLEIIYTL